MILALVLIGAFAALVWLGRRARKGRADWRLGASILSVLAFGGAVFAGLKGEWIIAVVLAGVGLIFLIDMRDRGRRPNVKAKSHPQTPAREHEGMTDIKA